MKLRHRSLLVLSAFVIAAGALAYGQSTAPQSGPSDLLDVYKNATTTWVSTAFGYANKLFGLLAFIDFTWAMIVLFLEGQEMQGWIAGFLKKFMTISFFYALLINQSTWFPAIINSFVQIGQQAGGVSGYLNPSDILWTGVQISGAILAACLPNAAARRHGWGHFGSHRSRRGGRFDGCFSDSGTCCAVLRVIDSPGAEHGVPLNAASAGFITDHRRIASPARASRPGGEAGPVAAIHPVGDWLGRGFRDSVERCTPIKGRLPLDWRCAVGTQSFARQLEAFCAGEASSHATFLHVRSNAAA